MLEVSALYYYPIKSLRGLAVDSAFVERRGLQGDRRMMVVDPDGMFLTQREIPKMALVSPAIKDERLTLSAAPKENLVVPLDERGRRYSVQVWDDVCEAADLGDAAAGWLSEFLGRQVRLVRMTDDFVRKVNPKYAVAPDDRTGFSDGYPILIISEASLADLNSRLETPLPMNRFRPNLVVRGCAPFAEDTWKRIRVGEVEIAVVKPCGRCEITTTDQDTAVRGKEPLKTLATFRRIDGKAMFGQNAIPLNEGRIKVGDEIEILK